MKVRDNVFSLRGWDVAQNSKNKTTTLDYDGLPKMQESVFSFSSFLSLISVQYSVVFFRSKVSMNQQLAFFGAVVLYIRSSWWWLSS